MYRKIGEISLQHIAEAEGEEEKEKLKIRFVVTYVHAVYE